MVSARGTGKKGKEQVAEVFQNCRAPVANPTFSLPKHPDEFLGFCAVSYMWIPLPEMPWRPSINGFKREVDTFLEGDPIGAC